MRNEFLSLDTEPVHFIHQDLTRERFLGKNNLLKLILLFFFYLCKTNLGHTHTHTYINVAYRATQTLLREAYQTEIMHNSRQQQEECRLQTLPTQHCKRQNLHKSISLYCLTKLCEVCLLFGVAEKMFDMRLCLCL